VSIGYLSIEAIDRDTARVVSQERTQEWPDPVADHPTPGMHLWGWMTPDQLSWLSAQAARMQSVAEVGSLYGRSSFALLTACNGPVHCIDPWPGHRYDSFRDECGHFPNLVAIREFSPAAAEQVPDVDMVFLDGDHEYERVLADIEAWLPRARKLLCGHDYGHPDHPGVAKAVEETFGDRVVLAGPGHLAGIWTVQTGDAPDSPQGRGSSNQTSAPPPG
jgi:hypothetical protein